MDLGYTNVQNLVAKPLHRATIDMFYFLNNIKGLARLSYYFESLLCQDAADNALRLCGSFLMKIMELQQIIDQCVTDMKLFFCWLLICIIHLNQNDVPEEIPPMVPEEILYLSEFINNFEDCVVKNGKCSY